MLLYIPLTEFHFVDTQLKDSNTKLTLFITFFLVSAGFVSISIVSIFCYFAAMSITKPLKQLIRIADFINNSAGDKTQSNEAIKNLHEVFEKNFYFK